MKLAIAGAQFTLTVLFSAVLMGCVSQTNQETSNQQNQTPLSINTETSSTLLTSLAEEVGAIFERDKPVSIRVPLQTADGFEYEFAKGRTIVHEASEQTVTEVLGFFTRAGFSERYVVDEEPVTISGFQNGSDICSVRSEPQQEGDQIRLEIQCIKIENADAELVNLTLIFRDLLASGLDANADGIRFTITKDADDFIRGELSEPETAQGNQFFLTKKNGDWELTYVGDEPFPCEELEAAEYPERLRTECIAEPEADAEQEQADEDVADDKEVSAENQEQLNEIEASTDAETEYM